MNTKILVTGATGNVGSDVIRAYSQPSQLIAGVRNVDRDAHALGIDAVYFDFADPASYASALAGVQAMFLVRPPTISNVGKYIVPVIEAAKVSGVEHIVFLSLAGVEAMHYVPHYKIEQAIRASGIDWTFLRAGFFMQNLNTTHCLEIRDRNEIAVPVGGAKTSFIDVRDIGTIAARALSEPEHRNKAYTLTGGEALDYYEVADILSVVLGRKITYTNPSIPQFILDQRGHRPLSYTLVMTMLYTLTRMGTADQVSPEAGELLNRPPITFRQYAEDYCEAWSVG